MPFHWVKRWRFCLGQQSNLYTHPICVSEDRKRGMAVVQRSEKNVQKSVPSSTVCVPGTELRSSGSAESTQTHWTICQPLPHVCFIYLILIRVLRINLYSPVEGCPESCELLQKRTALKGWGDSWDCQECCKWSGILELVSNAWWEGSLVGCESAESVLTLGSQCQN